jgi:hypothetical protein
MFRDNAVDVAVLPELSEADLEKLGVLCHKFSPP